MSKTGSAEDPKGLIFEAYRIEGITKPDCRTIFLDWALSLQADLGQDAALRQLVSRYAPEFPAHPLTEVLREGLQSIGAPRRRGGWRGRAGRSAS